MAIKPIPRSTNNTDYNVKLRDLANLKGLDVGYNQDTKAVSIGGQPFDTTGWQNIGGYNMGTEAMANDFLQNYKVPSGNVQTPVSKYQVPDANLNLNNLNSTPNFGSEINNTTNQLTNAVQGFGQAYDVTKDPVYNALADYQERRMLQLAGRTGSAYDSNTQARIGQANMQLGLQFQQQDQNRQLQNIQNLQGQLNTLTGLEDRAMNREQTLYGMALTPQTRDYMGMMQNVTPEQRQFLDQYKDNYAAVINQMDPSDPNRKIFEAARFQKVAADPVQFRDYLINDYGLSPFQVDNMVMGRKLEELKLQTNNEKDAMELEKLRLQVEKAGYESDEGYYDSLSAKIENSNLSDKLKAEIKSINARTNDSGASASLSKARELEILERMSPAISVVYDDFLKSGKSFNEWMSSINVNELSVSELKGLIDVARSSGRIGENEESEIQKAIANVINAGIGEK